MFYYIYISFFVPLTVLIPIKYAYSNYRYLTKAFKIILAFITFSAVINAVGTVLARGFHIQTTPIVHIYTPFEFAFLGFILRRVLWQARQKHYLYCYGGVRYFLHIQYIVYTKCYGDEQLRSVCRCDHTHPLLDAVFFK
jgi:hypothetical protein